MVKVHQHSLSAVLWQLGTTGPPRTSIKRTLWTPLRSLARFATASALLLQLLGFGNECGSRHCRNSPTSFVNSAMLACGKLLLVLARTSALPRLPGVLGPLSDLSESQLPSSLAPMSGPVEDRELWVFSLFNRPHEHL